MNKNLCNLLIRRDGTIQNLMDRKDILYMSKYEIGQEIPVGGILTAIGAGWKYCPNCGADMRGSEER